jgi:two-component system response regulator AtoC
MQTAIKAVQLGAFQYLMKPLSVKNIREEIKKAQIGINSSSKNAMQSPTDIADRDQLIGNSIPMHEIYKLIGSASTTPNHSTILITGETGTGKELAARAIHNNSAYPQEPYIAINCTALPETLLESELFGHEKGAFTGATTRKIGKFEQAGRGTIFLDEIGDLSPSLQKKLLRVLQEREFGRLGGNTMIPVEARFIAATNHDLESQIKEGTFREDLYFRLNIINIHLPPLRDHKEDIFMLAHFFLARYNKRLKKSVSVISEEALSRLQSYSYPGNIRELENIIERAVMLTQGNVILADEFCDITDAAILKQESLPIISSDFTVSRDHLLHVFEKQFIINKLTQHQGNVSAAAKASNMSRQNFHRLMNKHKIKANHTKTD